MEKIKFEPDDLDSAVNQMIDGLLNKVNPQPQAPAQKNIRQEITNKLSQRRM
ncbi:MAG: hypothetical protein WC262_08725 [Bacteroidales bacterium]|jgi:hypothetical protein